MYGIIIDYNDKGCYYKVKTEEGIYLAYQKMSNDIFNIGDTVYFQKDFIPLGNKIVKMASNVRKY